MSRVLNAFGHNELRQVGSEDILHVPFIMTTNGSGVPSLTYDYDGGLTVSRNGAGPFNYVLNFGNTPYKTCVGVIFNNSATAAATSFDPVAGTVTLTTAAAVNSAFIHGVAILEAHYS